jgi:hypothetical protein
MIWQYLHVRGDAELRNHQVLSGIGNMSPATEETQSREMTQFFLRFGNISATEQTQSKEMYSTGFFNDLAISPPQSRRSLEKGPSSFCDLAIFSATEETQSKEMTWFFQWFGNISATEQTQSREMTQFFLWFGNICTTEQMQFKEITWFFL